MIAGGGSNGDFEKKLFWTLIVAAVALSLAFTGDCVPPMLVHADIEGILNNPDVSENTSLSSLLYHDWHGVEIDWGAASDDDASWRPFVVWTFRAQLSLHGGHPLGLLCFHLFHISLHAACAFAVGLVSKRVYETCSPMAAAFAAILFCLHPASDSTLHFASGRSQMIGALCVLFTIYLSLPSRHRGSSRESKSRPRSTSSFLTTSLHAKRERNNVDRAINVFRRCAASLRRRFHHTLNVLTNGRWSVDYFAQTSLLLFCVLVATTSLREGVVAIPAAVFFSVASRSYDRVDAKLFSFRIACLCLPLLLRWYCTGHAFVGVATETGVYWTQTKATALREVLWPAQGVIDGLLLSSANVDGDNDEDRIISNNFIDQRPGAAVLPFVTLFAVVAAMQRFVVRSANRRISSRFFAIVSTTVGSLILSDRAPIGRGGGRPLPGQSAYLCLAGLCIAVVPALDAALTRALETRSALRTLAKTSSRKARIFGCAAIVFFVAIVALLGYALSGKSAFHCSATRQSAASIARSHVRREIAAFYMQNRQYDRAAREAMLGLEHQLVFVPNDASPPSLNKGNVTTEITAKPQLSSRSRAVLLHSLGYSLGEIFASASTASEQVSARQRAISALRMSLMQSPKHQFHLTKLKLSNLLLVDCDVLDEAGMYAREVVSDETSSSMLQSDALYLLAREQICRILPTSTEATVVAQGHTAALNLVRRALEVSPPNKSAQKLRNLLESVETTDVYKTDSSVLSAATGMMSSTTARSRTKRATVEAWQKVSCPATKGAPEQFLDSLWPQVRDLCATAVRGHSALPPSALAKAGLEPCVWLDHRVRVPFTLDGVKQEFAFALSENTSAIAALVCDIISPDDEPACEATMLRKMEAQREIEVERRHALGGAPGLGFGSEA
eukprot:g4214.t1